MRSLVNSVTNYYIFLTWLYMVVVWKRTRKFLIIHKTFPSKHWKSKNHTYLPDHPHTRIDRTSSKCESAFTCICRYPAEQTIITTRNLWPKIIHKMGNCWLYHVIGTCIFQYLARYYSDRYKRFDGCLSGLVNESEFSATKTWTRWPSKEVSKIITVLPTGKTRISGRDQAYP